MKEKLVVEAVEPSAEPGLDGMLKAIERLRNLPWQKQEYSPKDALIYRTETDIVVVPYRGQEYDPDKVELKNSYWDHDNCEICSLLLFQSDNSKHGIGYTDGDIWICAECHDKLLWLGNLAKFV